MADDPSLTSTEAGRRWALIFGGVTLAFCLCVIALTMIYGKPDNSLHSSGLAWAFSVAGAILAGMGFGTIAPLIVGKKAA